MLCVGWLLITVTPFCGFDCTHYTPVLCCGCMQDIYRKMPMQQSIVFVDRRVAADKVHTYL